MATINVQNATGTTASANSYISLADANTYFSDRNNSTWSAATDANKEFALINAWQYMDNAFSFLGLKLTSTQTTKWPRDSAYDPSGYEYSGIPVNLTYAQSEYALRALSADLLQDVTYETDGRSVSSEKSKVGPVETNKTYSGVVTSRRYPAADLLMRDLILDGATVVRL